MEPAARPTISDLFARDPLSLTKVDIDLIIDYYRTKRQQSIAGVKDAGSVKRTNDPIDLNELFGP